jgi:FixJ family two-component response regulator
MGVVVCDALRRTDTDAMIAIVDDDPSVRRSLARLLRSCGLSVEPYASAEEFLASEQGDSFALLIVDVIMVGMSGLDLLESLAVGGKPRTAIVITARDSDQTRERARRLGAPVLRKPVEGAELLATVGRAIGREVDSRGA